MMLDKMAAFVVNDNELDEKYQRLLSLVFLFIGGIMSFFEYTHVGWFWDSQLTFKPGFISTIIAIILVAPLYVRGILKWNKSIYTLLSLSLILLLFSSFIELAMGGDEKNDIIRAFLISAMVLSWLGMSAIAGVSWMLVLAAAVYAVIINDSTMGFYGFIYIGAGFLGLVLHSGLGPGQLVQGMKNEFAPSVLKAAKIVKQDTNTAVKTII